MALNGQGPHPIFLDGKNLNPDCLDGRGTNPLRVHRRTRCGNAGRHADERATDTPADTPAVASFHRSSMER